MDQLVLFMPFYFMFWSSLGLVSAYKTMRMLGYDENTVSATLLLSLTIPVFVLFSATILTEPVVFALASLGIWCVVKFWKSGGYQYPFFATLLFVAAAYTRADFIVFQFLGFVPLIVAASKRRMDWSKILVVATIFISVSTVFAITPSNSAVGTAQSLQSIVEATHQLPATVTPSNGSISVVTTVTSTLLNGSVVTTTYNPASSGNILYNALRFIAVGFGLGYNPIVGFLLAASLLAALYGVVRRRTDEFIPFWLGILGLGTFAGVLLVYSVVPDLPVSTAVRYSYDAMPAFFILVPILVAKLKPWKPKMLVPLLVVGALLVSQGVPIFQSSLQTNLTTSYPFLNGHQSFLTLDYRTPYAQIRDYFLAHPASNYIVIGEDIGSLDSNISNQWRFTPGVSSLNVTFEPYSYLQNHTGIFYLYVPSDIPSSDFRTLLGNKSQNSLSSYQPIFGGTSFFLARIVVV